MHSVTEIVSGAAGGRGAGHGFTLRVPVTSVRLRNIQREQSHDHWKRSSNRPLSPSRGVGATSAAASETVTSLASVTTAAHSAWAGFWLLSNDWRKHSASNALRAILIDIIQAQPYLLFFLYFRVYFDLCNVLKFSPKYTHAVQKSDSAHIWALS